MQVKLIVVGGKVDRTEVRLRLPAVLGRSRGADLTLGHPSISRRHCRLWEKDGMVVVEDLQSTNGTFVEEQRVDQATLEPGARLRVGPLTFVVVYDRQRSSSPPAGQDSVLVVAEPQSEEENILLAAEPPALEAVTPSQEQPVASPPSGPDTPVAREPEGPSFPADGPSQPQAMPSEPLAEVPGEEENEEDEELRRFLEGLQ